MLRCDSYLPDGQMSLLAGDHGEPLPPLPPPPAPYAVGFPPPPPPPPEGVPSPARAGRRRGRFEALPSGKEDLTHVSADSGREGEIATGQSSALPVVSQAGVHWLGFLLAETVLLLIFQFIAGMSTGSLALLADIGHSSADVVGYGINYYVERRKLAAATSAREGGGWSAVAATDAEKKADLLGCLISTVMLCVATAFASKEAIFRLRSVAAGASAGVGSGAEEFDDVGPALLSFAVVCTVANVGTLFLYRFWHERERRGGGSPLGPPSAGGGGGGGLLALSPGPRTPRSEVELGEYQAPRFSSMANPNAPPDVPPPPTPMGDAPPRRSRSARGGAVASDAAASADVAGGAPKLDLRSQFSGGACVDTTCTDAGCCSSSVDGSAFSSWKGVLHMLVHPGCDGSHHGSSGAADPAAPQDSGSSSSINLNVSAAVLHLVADVFRGITILVTAILIEARAVEDAGKADAVCALVVALFVALGSVALVQRMYTAVRHALMSSRLVGGLRALSA
mmetsp:Transcript_130580/g.418675  ORF Transcript_130580/g.418675 Transcript_130580/m.418675 type:complete len:509 (-) Transcript_130580:106-1632(-)